MTLLNQIVAVEKPLKATVNREVTDLYKDIQKTAPLNGISRTYVPKDDDGDRLPPESTTVQIKVEDILASLRESLTKLFDVTATKEVANTAAVADVKVDGNVLLKKVPVSYLLFLEKQLNDISTFVAKLPVLDFSESWSYDSNAGAYATAATVTTRTKKIPRNHVKAEATDKHPAQVDVFYEDVLVGYWSTVKFSGAIPADRAKQLADRVEALKHAVKFAREEANGLTVENQYVGSKVFDYLFS